MKYSKNLDSFLLLQFVFVALFCNVWMTTAKAADYPSKPITIVVGYSAGGGVDAIARILAEKLPSVIGQSVVVENRPSVGAIVGSTYVAKAKPDGYTLLMGAPGPIIFNQCLTVTEPPPPPPPCTLTPRVACHVGVWDSPPSRTPSAGPEPPAGEDGLCGGARGGAGL